MAYIPLGITGTDLATVVSQINQELLNIRDSLSSPTNPESINFPVLRGAPYRPQIGQCVIIGTGWPVEFIEGAAYIYMSDGWHQIDTSPIKPK